MKYSELMDDSSKVIYANDKTYNAIISKLGYQPSNLKLNPFLEDNKVYVMNEEKYMFYTCKFDK